LLFVFGFEEIEKRSRVKNEIPVLACALVVRKYLVKIQRKKEKDE